MGLSDQPETRQSGKRYAFYIAFVASLGGFLFGYDLVIISGAQIFIRDQFRLTPEQFGFATSSAILGCMLGPVFGARISDQFGRKAALFIAAALFALGALGTALATDISTFNVFRIIGGAGVGLASLASPMYIAEIAPAKSRGRLGLMYQLAITIGTVSATVVSYFLAKDLAATISWRWMLASVLVPVMIFSFLLIPVPSSPRWLVERKRYDEAFRVLCRIGGLEEGRRELEEIRSSIQFELGGIRELCQPGMRAALGTGLALAVFSLWCGWSGLSFYMPTLFQNAGFRSPSDTITQNIIVNSSTVLLTLVAVWVVDRLGRRLLWIGCSVTMCGCLVLAGILYQLHATGEVVVFAILLCGLPYNLGLGPLPWLMMSELFPTKVRAKAVSLSTTVLWLAAFTSTFAFPLMESMSEHLLHNVSGVFWFYAAVCGVAAVWGWKLLPETRGKTLEEIANSWAHKRQSTFDLRSTMNPGEIGGFVQNDPLCGFSMDQNLGIDEERGNSGSLGGLRK